MNATKKLAIAAVLLTATSIFSIIELSKNTSAETTVSATTTSRMILYYGSSCSHCKTVESYIEQNTLAEKLQIEQKEVWDDQKNQVEFTQVAQNCGLGSNNLGVPMLWNEKTQECYLGDRAIIDFLSAQEKNIQGYEE